MTVFLGVLLFVLKVLGGIFAVLLVLTLALLFSPARVRFCLQGSLRVWAGLGPVMLTMWPPKPGKKAEKSAKEAKPKAKAKKNKSPKSTPRQLTFALLIEYLKLGSDALGSALRAVKISRLKLHATVAAEDPGQAALAYGGAAAALGALLPGLEKNINWRATDVVIDVDFEGKADLSFDIVIKAMPVVLLIAGVKLLLRLRKLNAEGQAEQKAEPQGSAV